MKRTLLVLGLIVGTAVPLLLTAPAHATSSCLPNPGAACAWDHANYAGAKIYGDPSPTNGTADVFSPSNWDRLRSVKNRSAWPACPVNSLPGGSWQYLDLIPAYSNLANAPLADKTADGMFFGVSPSVNCT